MRLMVEWSLAGQRDDDLRLYQARDEEFLARLRQLTGGIAPDRIVSWPSLVFQWSGLPEGPGRRRVEDGLDSLYLGVEFDDPARGEAFLHAMRQAGVPAGAEVSVNAGESWCPPGDAPPFFETREAADRLIAAEALRQEGLRGEGVNIVFLDEGINAASLAARFAGLPGAAGTPRFIGGWRVNEPGLPAREPGEGTPDGHGTMVALNALSLAPNARIFDMPVLPDQIHNVRRYTSLVAAALAWMQLEIRIWLGDAYPGPWVFCNAWGIYDRRFERPQGSYTGNPLHPLNRWVARYDATWGRDQVFAAGNCGQFCASSRCGPGDQGPGESILGANSSPHVLTLGGVRGDGMWIGYSSQGPGQAAFLSSPVTGPVEGTLVQKPDLCAPSHFVEPGDGRFLSSGTSAACGLAAGAVAALRDDASPARALSPAALRALLRDTAQRPAAMTGAYDLRFGAGILDLEAALRAARRCGTG